MFKFKSFVKVFIITLFVFNVNLVIAQPDDEPPPDPQTDPDVPITGVELLVGAGAALGIKKILDKRKKA